MVEESISREWIVYLGRRSTWNAWAHLFCEVYFRLEALGLGDGKIANGRCRSPNWQTPGLSAVHANRWLQDLRRLGWYCSATNG